MLILQMQSYIQIYKSIITLNVVAYNKNILKKEKKEKNREKLKK